jgi:hypothetical protein
MEKKKVLITVKTYPLPSEKYLELVCTAGMLEDGSFIRLYPVDFRYLHIWQRYKKYQWIEVEVEKHDRDNRKESYRPDVKSISLLGEPLGSKDGWQARKAIVLKQLAPSMEALWEHQKQDGTSLGIIKPREIKSFVVEPDAEEWKPKWKADIEQLRLFGPDRKPLQKIPYKFSYRFLCDNPDCKGHQMMIEDWEVGELYIKEVARLGSPEQAVESVRHKFFNVLCAPERETYFFVGTVQKYQTWVIIGVFWPPKPKIISPSPPSLFD